MRFALAGGDAAQMLADCINSHAQVTGHSMAVAGMRLPALSGAPQWYGDFMTSWIAVAAHAKEWVDRLAPDVQEIPRSVEAFAAAFADRAAAAQQGLAALRQTPQDSVLRKGLSDNLHALETLIGPASDEASAFLPQLQGFAARLAPDHKVLTNAAQAAMTTIGADAAEVQTMVADVANLRARIDADNKILAAASIEEIVGIVIGVIGVGLTMRAAPGVGVWVGRGMQFLGTALFVAGAVSGMLAQQDLKDAQKKIDQDTRNMADLQMQAAALQCFLDQAGTLAEAVDDSSAGLARMTACWRVLSDDLAAVREMLSKADAALAQGDLDALGVDLTEAAADWAALQPLVSRLASMPIEAYPEPQYVGQQSTIPH
jgi:Bacillus haemolytic enterotoxin (HBL)